MVEAALAVGCEVDALDGNAEGNDESTALELAMRTANIGVVRVLLAAGAHPDGVSSPCFRAPLACAASRGHTDIVRALIEAGADVMLRAGDGETALHRAACNGQSAALQVLLDAGTDVNARDRGGRTPLEDALLFGFRTCLGPLLRAGATLDDTRLSRLRRNTRNASAWRYIERVQAAGGYDQLVQTYRRVLTAPRGYLTRYLRQRFGRDAPHDVAVHVLAFWKAPGGP